MSHNYIFVSFLLFYANSRNQNIRYPNTDNVLLFLIKFGIKIKALFLLT